MSGTLYPGAPNPAEALERQTGNRARDLARAIARIGELDVTRTLPGRLVWYAEPGPVIVSVTWPNGEPDPGPVWCEDCHRHRYSVDETGRCFTCRAVANGYVPRSAKPGLEAWPNGEAKS